MYHTLEPEVAGSIGGRSVRDTSVHPPIISKLHYHFDGWLGDELLENFPCFIVTENLRQIIEKATATGCTFDNVEITKSEQFLQLFPGVELPVFYWLQITGTAGIDDIGFADDYRIAVSDRVFQKMKSGAQLTHCDVETT